MTLTESFITDGSEGVTLRVRETGFENLDVDVITQRSCFDANDSGWRESSSWPKPPWSRLPARKQVRRQGCDESPAPTRQCRSCARWGRAPGGSSYSGSGRLRHLLQGCTTDSASSPGHQESPGDSARGGSRLSRARPGRCLSGGTGTPWRHRCRARRVQQGLRPAPGCDQTSRRDRRERRRLSGCADLCRLRTSPLAARRRSPDRGSASGCPHPNPGRRMSRG